MRLGFDSARSTMSHDQKFPLLPIPILWCFALTSAGCLVAVLILAGPSVPALLLGLLFAVFSFGLIYLLCFDVGCLIVALAFVACIISLLPASCLGVHNGLAFESVPAFWQLAFGYLLTPCFATPGTNSTFKIFASFSPFWLHSMRKSSPLVPPRKKNEALYSDTLKY